MKTDTDTNKATRTASSPSTGPVEAKYERWCWIVEKIIELRHVDILNEAFVDEYISKFNPKHRVTNWGANKCRLLSSDLNAMAKSGVLDRGIIGLPHGNWEPGFPKWVYTYSLGFNAGVYKPNNGFSRAKQRSDYVGRIKR